MGCLLLRADVDAIALPHLMTSLARVKSGQAYFELFFVEPFTVAISNLAGVAMGRTRQLESAAHSIALIGRGLVTPPPRPDPWARPACAALEPQ